ncbi:MAG TPA: EF-hand domain-containing protein [Gemmataceae bacterium]|jgi:Ca2+-binding EF-hand superfamily protein|nr:EF-hand domain-containing protein [Gemmataceae bacterium]
MKRFAGFAVLLAGAALLACAGSALADDKKNNVDLESVFKILDVNNDKVVTLKEFQAFDGIGRIKVVTNKEKDKEKDAKTRAEIFKRLDTKKNGKLTFEEFKKITDFIDEYALNKKK